jgi:hypothetical protein
MDVIADPLLELTRASYVMAAWDVIAFAVWAATRRRRRR